MLRVSEINVSIRGFRTLRGVDNRFNVIIDAVINGRGLKIIVSCLTRNPVRINASATNEFIKFEFIDENNRGFATCYVGPKVLQSECKELICSASHTWIISDEHLKEHCVG